MYRHSFPLILACWLLVQCLYAIAAPPKYVYRGDSRRPEQIQAAGGFFPPNAPKSVSKLTEKGLSLPLHQQVGSSRDTNYVSTSSDPKVAAKFAGNNGHLYKIKASQNMVDMNKSLGQKTQFPAEKEHAALGGILHDQIKGTADKNGNIIQKNEAYNKKKYKGQRGGGANPQLAYNYNPSKPKTNEKLTMEIPTNNGRVQANICKRSRSTNCVPQIQAAQEATKPQGAPKGGPRAPKGGPRAAGLLGAASTVLEGFNQTPPGGWPGGTRPGPWGRIKAWGSSMWKGLTDPNEWKKSWDTFTGNPSSGPLNGKQWDALNPSEKQFLNAVGEEVSGGPNDSADIDRKALKAFRDASGDEKKARAALNLAGAGPETGGAQEAGGKRRKKTAGFGENTNRPGKASRPGKANNPRGKANSPRGL